MQSKCGQWVDETFSLCCGAYKVRSSGCWRRVREYTCTLKSKAEEDFASSCLVVTGTLEQLDIDTSVADTQSVVHSCLRAFASMCSANTSAYRRRFTAFSANVWSSILTAAKLQNKTINSALIITSEHTDGSRVQFREQLWGNGPQLQSKWGLDECRALEYERAQMAGVTLPRSHAVVPGSPAL